MNARNLIIWTIVIVMLLAFINVFQGAGATQGRQLSTSQFMRALEQGQIEEVKIEGEKVTGTFREGGNFESSFPINSDPMEYLERFDIKYDASAVSESSPLLRLLFDWFPVILLIGVWIFFMRQMQGGAGRAMGFGKSKAKLLTERSGRVTFDDVAGVDEAKDELQEIVDFLKDPAKFQRLGGKIPKGALLIGPPGTGKTLLARAIAGEANVPFFSISGSDFVEMFVGVGASRVRDMFEQAKKNAPCIIFIDEIDAVGRHRGSGLGNGNDEREQTLNQLLVEMDGFEANEGIILIAATNRPDVLDRALLRPGRFDRQINVPNPDIIGREKIIKVHMKDVPISGDVDAKVIARGTPGFSGADLANLVNEAALLAARKNKRQVSMADFEAAKDKVLMGPERKSMAMSDKEKELTAYHEAGHAIVSLHTPGSDPVHKATIIPRGRALGMVMYLPEEDKLSTTREELLARLATAMGGRVAEEIKFGHDKVTTGAASDIQMATRIARAMVTQMGLSDVIGPIDYSDDDDGYFGPRKIISPETARKIEDEVKGLVQGGLDRARKIIEDNRGDWETLAQALLQYETLSGDEIKALLEDGTPPHRPEPPKEPEPEKPAPAAPASAVPTTRPRPGDMGPATARDRTDGEL